MPVSPSPGVTVPDRDQIRRARWAVAVLFASNGATFASMVPRYPEIIDHLAISHTVFGLVIALGPIGALVTGPFAAALMRRVGSGPMAVWTQLLTFAAVALVLVAPHLWIFAAGIVLFAMFDVFTDIGQNSHGLRVQRYAGKSLINGFHACWSLGAMLGGLLGAVFAAVGLALTWHALVMTVLLVLVNLQVRRGLLPGPERPEETEESAAELDTSPSPSAPPVPVGDRDGIAGARPRRRVPSSVGVFVALGLIAVGGALIEDAGFTWSTLFLGGELGAPAGLAGAGVVVLMGFHTLGRFLGDPLVDRFGERAVVTVGCAAATVALAVALLWPSLPLVLVAFAIAGFGVATVVPAAFHAADRVPGLRSGSGLLVVNLTLRTAFILSPPFVGWLSDLTDLRTALVVMPVATALVVVLSGALAPRRR